MNKADLIAALKPELVPGTMIVIKGSRSNAMEDIVKALIQ